MIRRLGTPGGPLTFGFLIDEGLPTETIVYARGLITAILKYRGEGPLTPKPWSVRQMSDGE